MYFYLRACVTSRYFYDQLLIFIVFWEKKSVHFDPKVQWGRASSSELFAGRVVALFVLGMFIIKFLISTDEKSRLIASVLQQRTRKPIGIAE